MVRFDVDHDRAFDRISRHCRRPRQSRLAADIRACSCRFFASLARLDVLGKRTVTRQRLCLRRLRGADETDCSPERIADLSEYLANGVTDGRRAAAREEQGHGLMIRVVGDDQRAESPPALNVLLLMTT